LGFATPPAQHPTPNTRAESALGYPRRLKVGSKPEQRWQYPAYWRRLLSGGGCTLIGFDGPAIEVVSLTPLP